ncbi:uncharacterized protein LOC132272402 [Cornus florida]|uniref:uncharacterized protein LOC132272402 n=1 Tax=Cornus florida TaxID=4283 RepID=UPI0028A02839|nr:uncharacterized protein LOC132272402 [Cornus florida]
MEARKIRMRAAKYCLIKGVLYKKGFSLPYLHCVSIDEANYILKDIHEGLCGNHAGGRSLAHKAIRQGYFWPTMRKDALEFVKKCDKCQRFAMSGAPRVIVTDNGKQFESEQFLDFCNELGVKVHFSSPAHPQAKGQVEVTNRTILKMIKTRLEKAKGLWREQLPGVLWAYRTTVRTPTGETPFGLAFGSEVVIPVEIKFATFRTKYFEPQQNEMELQLNLDLIEKKESRPKSRLQLTNGWYPSITTPGSS